MIRSAQNVLKLGFIKLCGIFCNTIILPQRRCKL